MYLIMMQSTTSGLLKKAANIKTDRPQISLGKPYFRSISQHFSRIKTPLARRSSMKTFEYTFFSDVVISYLSHCVLTNLEDIWVRLFDPEFEMLDLWWSVENSHGWEDLTSGAFDYFRSNKGSFTSWHCH